jgi:arylsulfatase A-like enzyme
MSNFSRRDFLNIVGGLGLGLVTPHVMGRSRHIETADNKNNILIVVFDALSAYHLSEYGYGRETMPNLSKILDKAIVYHNHYSGGNYTTPGTATILTGALPWSHRAILHNDTVADEFITKNLFSAFQDYYRMSYSHNILVNTQLKQFFSDIEGFTPRNQLFVGNDAIVNQLFSNDEDIASVSWARALKQSDDGYAYSLYLSRINDIMKEKRVEKLVSNFPRGLPYINIDNYYILEHGIDYLIQQLRQVSTPFLGYFHFLPPHEPYHPRKEFIGKFINSKPSGLDKPDHLFSQGNSQHQMMNNRNNYDEFILYTDHEFARLFTFMEQNGFLENTWLILTSDHGELFERGIIGHSTPVLHEPVIRVPLIIFEPGRSSRLDIHSLTSGMDILPTLLEVNGYQIPAWIEGEVLPPFRDNDTINSRNIFALQAKGSGKRDPIVKGTVMLVRGEYKLMYYFGYKELDSSGRFVELYNLADDPNEINNHFHPLNHVGMEMIEIIQTKLEEVNQPFL